MYKGLDERPQIELTALQFDAGRSLNVLALFQNIVNQRLKTLHVAVECFQHLASLSAGALPRKPGLENLRGKGNSIKRATKIVRHKCQIFFTAPLHFERLLSGKCLDGQPDRLVQNAIQGMERLSLQAEVMLFG